MKKNLKLLSTIILLLLCYSSHAQTSTFFYTGTIQTYTVPVGIISVGVDVIGASGGFSYGSPGGCGGEVVCTLSVTPGEVLNLYVGSTGGAATFISGGTGGNTGPTVSGGMGGTSLSFGGGGGGGGASDIRIGGLALANREVVAGGGGGGGDDCGAGDDGGPGGAAIGGNGLDCS